MAKQGEPRLVEKAPAGGKPVEETPPVGAAMVLPPEPGLPVEQAGSVRQEGGPPDESATAENFDPELLRQAAEYGLTTEEVGRFSDNATLGAAMSVFDRRIAGLAERRRAAAPVEGRMRDEQGRYVPAAGRERPPQLLAPPPRAAAGDGGEPEAIDLDFDPDLVDPKVAKALRALHDRVESSGRGNRITQMEQVLKSMIQRDRNRYVQEFDRAIEKMGPEYADLFGTGPTATLARRGMHAELDNRLRCDGMMGTIASGLEGAGMGVPSEVFPLMRRAAAVQWGDRTAARARREIRESMEENAGQTIARSAGQPAATGDPDNPMMFMRREFEQAGRKAQQKSSA